MEDTILAKIQTTRKKYPYKAVCIEGINPAAYYSYFFPIGFFFFSPPKTTDRFSSVLVYRQTAPCPTHRNPIWSIWERLARLASNIWGKANSTEGKSNNKPSYKEKAAKYAQLSGTQPFVVPMLKVSIQTCELQKTEIQVTNFSW